MERRNRINLRLDDSQFEELRARAEEYGLKETDYLRRMIGYGLRSNPELIKLICALQYEFNRIGNNINQIAKRINAGYKEQTDNERLVAYLKKLENSVNRVVDAVGNIKD